MSATLKKEPCPIKGDEVRYFYLRSELHRCAIYATGGCLLISVLFWFVAVDRELWEKIITSEVCASIAVWMSQYFLLARIRIDHRGISRRILLWWDLWSWEAFADGQIRHADQRSVSEYIHSRKLWGLHRLRLESLNREDELEVDSLIRKVWTPPPMVPLPKSFRIKKGRFNGKMVKHVDLTASHLTIVRKKETTEFQWSDIEKVEIRRIESNRADFERMFIHFNDNKLKVIQNQDPELRAPDEIFSDFILEYVTTERIQDYAFDGPLRSLEELEYRKDREERQLRNYDQMRWIMVVAFSLSFLAAFFVDLDGVVMLSAISLLALIGGYFGRKESKKHLGDYETERARFLGNNESATS